MSLRSLVGLTPLATDAEVLEETKRMYRAQIRFTRTDYIALNRADITLLLEASDAVAAERSTELALIFHRLQGGIDEWGFDGGVEITDKSMRGLKNRKSP